MKESSWTSKLKVAREIFVHRDLEAYNKALKLVSVIELGGTRDDYFRELLNLFRPMADKIRSTYSDFELTQDSLGFIFTACAYPKLFRDFIRTKQNKEKIRRLTW